MLKLLPFVLLVFTSAQLFSQVTWNKTYRFLNATSAHDFFENQNNQLIVSGSTFSSSSSSSREMFLLNVNGSSGDSLQAVQCAGSFSSCGSDRLFIRHLFDNPQGELFSIGESAFNNVNPILAKHQNGFIPEWKINLLLDTIHYVNEVVTFSDGFVLAGQFSGNDYIVQKRDYQGKKVWSRRIFVSQIGMEPQLVALANNQVAILYRDGLNFGTVYLECFDRDGKSLWRKSTNGAYLLGSSAQAPYIYTIESARTTLGTYILKKYAANTGNLVWESTKEDRNFSASALVVDAQDQVYIAGTLVTGSGTFFSLAKMDASGKFLWRNHFPDIFFTLFRKILITKDQELAVLVSYDNASSIRIAKIKGTGLVSSSHELNVLNDLQLSPNPVQNSFNVSSDSFTKQKFAYQLSTSSGQKLAQGQINSDQQNIDVSYFPKGIYFLIFTDERGQSFARKIIKN